MDVFKVWVPPREHLSVQALYGATNASYWKCFKRQNSTHLTPLKHQNTKTSLYKLSKNHWVITLFEIFGSVRRDLQSTVSLDHPVFVLVTASSSFQSQSQTEWRKLEYEGETLVCNVQKIAFPVCHNKSSSSPS